MLLLWSDHENISLFTFFIPTAGFFFLKFKSELNLFRFTSNLKFIFSPTKLCLLITYAVVMKNSRVRSDT